MEVRRKQNESVTALMRRFSRLAQQTGVVAHAKSKRSYVRKPTQRIEKNRAIMRVELQALRRRLERLGKYDDETFEEEKRKIKQQLDL
ncbi:MAG: 30S ribosomal protein S21 [Patescibacteria group bacterium]